MSTEKIDFLDEEGNCKDNQQQQGLPLIERNNADHDNTEPVQAVATTELQKKQEYLPRELETFQDPWLWN